MGPAPLRRSGRLHVVVVLLIMMAAATSMSQDRWHRIEGPYSGRFDSHDTDTATGDIYVTSSHLEIFRSTDQGESWRIVRESDSATAPPLYASDIVREGSRLWAYLLEADVNRLYRSDDSGRTWRNVLDRFTRITEKGTSIAFDLPYIVVGTETGTYASSDSGVTFERLSATAYPFRTASYFNYHDGIAAAGSGLYHTTDRGVTWRKLSDGRFHEGTSLGEIVDVVGPTILWARRERDGKQSFLRTIDSGATMMEIRKPHYPQPHWLHVDNGILYYTHNDSGAFRSTDMGETWQALPLLHQIPFNRLIPLPSGEYITALATFSQPSHVDGLFKSYGGGRTWRQVGGYDGSVVDLDFSGDTIYAAGTQLWRNYGRSRQWELLTYSRTPAVNVMVAEGGDTLWTLDIADIHRSDNTGEVWEDLQANMGDARGASRGTTIVRRALYSMQGTVNFPPGRTEASRRLMTSTTQGLTWTVLIDSSRLFHAMQSESVVPFGGSLYVRAMRRVDSLPALFRSDDDGVNWMLVDSTLPDYPVTSEELLPLQTHGDRFSTRYGRNAFAVYIRTDPNDPTALRREIIAHPDTAQTMAAFAYHDGYYYAAIGRGPYHFPSEESKHVGMVRTNDNGLTWHPFNTEEHKPHQGTKLFHHGGDLYMLDGNAIYTTSGRNRYRLTILNGYGSGYYDAGDTVHIWSRALSPIEVFDAWEAPVAPNDSLLPLRGDEWHTTLVMPAANVTLTAAIDTLAETTFLSDTLDLEIHTIPVRYALPPQAKGVILLFHDQRGGASDWLTETENHQFVRDALHAGFALIAIDAIRTEDKGPYWNGDPPDLTNIDIDRIVGALGELVQRSPSLAGLPFYSVGVGNGGDFAAALSGALGHRAAGLYVAGGSPDVVTRFDLPIIFSITEQDRPGGPTRTAAENHSGSLALRGIATELAVNAASPLYAERFARIPGIDTALSRLLVEEIAAGGHLDERRHLRTHPDALVAAAAADPTAYPLLSTLPPPLDHDLLMQLKAVYSAPVFFSDLNKNTLRFFCDLLPSSVLSAASHGRAAILAVAVDNGVSVRYRLAEAGAVEIRLFDLLGRAVATLYEGTSGKGENVATSTEIVPSGGYLIRMETADGEVVTRYVSVVR